MNEAPSILVHTVLLSLVLTCCPSRAQQLVIDTPCQMWGQVAGYDEVRIVNGAVVTVPPAQWNGTTWEKGYLVIDANTIYIDAQSAIRADGAGFGTDDGRSDGGPGHGSDVVYQGLFDFQNVISADGAGYGGRGGSSSETVDLGGSAYGSKDHDDADPNTIFGSSGGDWIWDYRPAFYRHYRGGRGGGYIHLKAASITIEGTISANGAPGRVAEFPPYTAGSGGGSGGQIILDSPNLIVTGSAVIEARGGNGSDPDQPRSSGAGSGGRIKILQPPLQLCQATLSVAGGLAAGGRANGSAGSIFIQDAPAETAPRQLSLDPNDDTGLSDHDNITALARPHITGIAPPHSLVRLYASPLVVATGYADPTGRFSIPAPLPDGTHIIIATAQSFCFNESSPSYSSVTVTVDTTAPAPPSRPDLLEQPPTAGRFLDDDVVSDPTPTFQGTADPNTRVLLYADGLVIARTMTTDNTWTVSSRPLSTDAHVITAKAIDMAGNESDPSDPLPILVDLEPPQIFDIEITPTGCYPAGRIFTIRASLDDRPSGPDYDTGILCDLYYSARTHLTTLTLTHQGAGLFQSLWDSTGRPSGTYTIDLIASDIAGNVRHLITAATACLDYPTAYCGDQTHPYPAADFTRDCYVDLRDLQVLADQWLAAVGELTADIAPFGSDGTVNIYDLATLAQHWLTCTDPYPPCSYQP